MRTTIIRAAQTAVFLGLLAIGGPANAYDASDPATDALKRAATLDCATQPDECRYLAALEYIAFARTCPAAIAKKFHTEQQEPKNASDVEKYINEWSALNTPELKTAVLAPNNKLRRFLEQTTAQYLAGLPSDDLGIECARIGVIKRGELPEYMSDLLAQTKNYETWRTTNVPANAAQ
jgi:hypothetical protein